ncbi:isochorismatase family cysteine hydrolase [Novosphingobium sp. BL-8A]|uniref:cysteine hydrolase family protein n=1 Tax=Novosphingobium sp. BL-8A TaxID=3127639 RepID=UPI00375847FF
MLTVLDPVTALIVVDLQKGLMDYPFIHPIEPVVQRAAALIAAFRARELPVVLVNATGRAPGRTEQPGRGGDAFPDGFADFLPELGQHPDDIVVTKRTWGAFTGTGLDERLKALGVTQVVVAGVATGTGVDATARQAYELGFNVTLAIDAMTDSRQRAHDYSIEALFPRLGETGTTEAIVELLAARAC